MVRKMFMKHGGDLNSLSQSAALDYGCRTVRSFYWSQEETLADVCNKNVVHRHSLTHTLYLRHTYHTGSGSSHRCVHVSPESNNITSFSSTIRLGRLSSVLPSLIPVSLCLSICLLLSLSPPAFVSLLPLWHFEAPPVILPA